MKSTLLSFLILLFLFQGGSNGMVIIQDGDFLVVYKSPGMTMPPYTKFIVNVTQAIEARLESAAFQKVMISLIVSENIYYISNQVSTKMDGVPSGYLQFVGFPHGGGIIEAGNSTDPEYIAHELYHAFQYDKRGLLPNCVCNELEAYIFQELTNYESGVGYYTLQNPDELNQRVIEAIQKLIFEGFTYKYFNQGIIYFKYSVYNINGLYSGLELCPKGNYDLPLIAYFLPLEMK